MRDGVRVEVGRARNGMGLFATESVKAGDTVIRVEGRIVHHTVLWRQRGSAFSANCIRFGPESYLDPGDHACRYLNHSCSPNAGIRKVNQRLYLFAVQRIGAGSEIVIDYSTTIGDDDIWTMRCRCGSTRCRGMIGNFSSLPTDVKHRYLTKGLVPGYIVRTLSQPSSGAPRP